MTNNPIKDLKQEEVYYINKTSFFSFILLILIEFQILAQPCIPWINLTGHNEFPVLYADDLFC